MATNYHAEHVGSLLRPPWLLEARSACKQGRITAETLREAEDRAALEALELQHQAGIEIFTDGEMRRDTWMAGLLESTGGVVPAELAPVRWHRNRGTAPAEETSFDTVAASEKVTRKGAHTSVEARFLAAHAPGQLGMHICRGNNRSAWMAQGSYEPVAERLFGEVGVDRFLLEYDTERAGGFGPLRFIRPGTTVVLGLVSSKQPQLESVGDLRRRIEEAARYVPVGDLALSPQCGFASTSRGNQLTVDDERRKLELVVSTAGEIWG